MSNSVQNPNTAHSEDTLMESPKGKGKAVQEDVPVDDSDSDDDDDEVSLRMPSNEPFSDI